ncbi:hypothetical protein ACPB8Q_00760 [Methanocaldococcus indicus]|uniref:hypothetical protein n=1 Tax=Methanocaldococcus indicus TaxID=213231 RepID=UPI003C6D212F
MDYKLLKIKTIGIEIINFGDFDRYEKIKLDDIEKFLEYVDKLKINTIFKYKDNIIDIFYIVDENKNIIYYIDAYGFENLYDYIEAKILGFTAEEYYIFKTLGSLEEYNRFKTSGFKDVKEYLRAKELGYIGCLEILKEHNLVEKYFDDVYLIYYLKNGFKESVAVSNDYDIYKFATNNYFNNFNTFLEALKIGFGNYNEYFDAIKRGFTDAVEYYTAISLGFQTAKDYYNALDLGIHTVKEYEEYKKLSILCALFKLETFEEGYLINILLDLDFNKEISLDDLYNKLLEKRNLLRLKKKINNHVFSNITKPFWYSTKFINIDDLENFLKNSLVIKFFGEYIEDKKIFLKKYTTNPKNILVLIGLYCHQKPTNLEDIIRAIKDIGFEYISIISNKEIKQEGIFSTVKLENKDNIKNILLMLINRLNTIIISNIELNDKFENFIELEIINSEANIDTKILKDIYNNISIKRLKILRNMMIK